SVEERRMIAGRALIGEVQLEQRFFQLETRAFQFSPMQKPMRIEGVPDAALGPVIEGEAERGAVRLYHFSSRLRTLWRRSILLRHMLNGVLAFRRHIGIKLKRL